MIAPRAHRSSSALTAALLAAAVVAGGCRHGTDADDAGAALPRPAAEDAPHRLTLDADAATRAGLRTVVAEPAEARSAVEAFGMVLDPLPLVEALHARDAARAAEAVARAELERATRLHRDDQNASARDVEAARAARAAAAATLADATARLRLAWGALAEQGDGFATELVDGRAALARIDVPPGPPPAAPAPLLTVAAAADPARRAVARLVGRAPTTDPRLQGESHFAVLPADRFPPGTVLTTEIPRDGAVFGVTVPAAAIVWADAAPAVYLESAPGELERRAVTLGTRDGDRWVVTSGLAAGEHVVAAGAARLLSADVLAASPAED